MTLLTLTLRHPVESRRRIGMLRILLDADADPNLGSDYRLPLELACATGPEAVALLLAAGADPNQRTREGRPAFFHAIGLPVGRAIFPMMNAHGANLRATDANGGSALDLARLNGDRDAERLILPGVL